MGAKFGQHFLKNKEILSAIPEYAEISKNDVVLEIGAGTGNLTSHLISAKKVYAIEIDEKLFKKLRENTYEFNNIVCINTDILKYEFPKDINKIIGNLPYKISSPITEKILKFLNEQKLSGVKNVLAVLMYQKEFAERLVAFAGMKDYSRISILASYFADVELLRTVGKYEFRPPPKVDSAIVRFLPKGVQYDASFFNFVKLLFMHKNKRLTNALIYEREFLKIKDKKRIKEILSTLPDNLSKEKVFYLEINELFKVYKALKGKLI